MPEFIENILIGVRQWVNSKLEAITHVVSSNINELFDIKLEGVTFNGTSATITNNVAAITANVGDINVIETVKVNGSVLIPDSNKAVDITVPTNYKTIQTAVSDPTASSTTSTTFIDSISLDTNGVITATKKTLPTYPTGTVTSVSAGVGLTTSDGNSITSSGTVKAKLNSETSLGTIGTTDKLYAVGVDSNGQLAVNVPWTDNNDNTTYSFSQSGNTLTITPSTGSASTYTPNIPSVQSASSYLTIGGNGSTTGTDIGTYVPVGAIQMYAGSSAPLGWLLCNGGAVSRGIYLDLFNVIGTTYGSGDGSTTFNIPNLSGKFPLGVNTSHAIGSTGGSETVTLTDSLSGLPSHTHKILHGESGSVSADGVSLTRQSSGYTYGTLSQTADSYPIVEKIGGEDAAEAHENMPPYLTINYIIKY